MCQPRIPIPPGDPLAGLFARRSAAAGGYDDSHATPSHRRIHDRLAGKHDEARERPRNRGGVFLLQAGPVDVRCHGLAVMVDEATAMVRKRAWSADAALADAGRPALAIGARGSPR